MFTGGSGACPQGRASRSVLRTENNIHVAIKGVQKDRPYAQKVVPEHKQLYSICNWPKRPGRSCAMPC